METERPKWTHETAEDLARWLVSDFVTKITHHWEMTGPDTSRDWIVLHREKDSRTVPTRFFTNNPDFEFSPDHACLVRERPYSKVRDDIEKIDKWEKANARDRSEFERLKRKFA